MQTVGEMFNGLSQVIKSSKLNCVVPNSEGSTIGTRMIVGTICRRGCGKQLLISSELKHEDVSTSACYYGENPSVI